MWKYNFKITKVYANKFARKSEEEYTDLHSYIIYKVYNVNAPLGRSQFSHYPHRELEIQSVRVFLTPDLFDCLLSAFDRSISYDLRLAKRSCRYCDSYPGYN